MPTEADWKAHIFNKKSDLGDPKLRTINEAYLRQAATDASLLTGHPAWDTYLQRLQVQLDAAKAELAQWHDKIATAYADTELRTVQIQINVWGERVTTIQHCMNLPKEILSHAHDTLDNARQ